MGSDSSLNPPEQKHPPEQKQIGLATASSKPDLTLHPLANQDLDNPANQLVNLFYPELRRIAATRMRNENAQHTWQPTALISELYLELRKVRTLRPVDKNDEDGKAAFIGFAANLMKRLLIHHARPMSAQAKRVDVEETHGDVSSFESLKEMEIMLERLGELEPQLKDIVQLKVFEGLTEVEIAKQLGCSLRTVTRHWHFARHWLQREMGLTSAETNSK